MADKHLARLLPLCETKYEKRFLQEVLPRVPQMPWDELTAQHEWRDSDGRRRRFDFAIGVPGTGLGMALEVDGYQKTGRSGGMTRAQFRDATMRRTSAVAQGWRVLNFTNIDVRDNVLWCAQILEQALRKELAIVEALAQREGEITAAASELQRREQELTALRRRVQDDGHARETLEERLLTATREADELRERVARESLGGAVADEIRQQVDAAIARAMVVRRRSSAVIAAAAAAGVIVVAAVTAAAVSGRPVGQPAGGAAPARTVPFDVSAGTPTPPCTEPISWRQARHHVGERVTIGGPLVEATYAAHERGRPTFLNIGGGRRDPDRFVALIWGAQREDFEYAPERLPHGSQLCVEGTVTMYRGVPQIVIKEGGDVHVPSPSG